MISIMVCPLKELDTSALSVLYSGYPFGSSGATSPRRLTEGVLEGEGPTSADAGVASCLLFDTETEFRRLRDDFWDGLVFEDGMKRLGGIELPRKGYVGRSRKTGAIIGAGAVQTSKRYYEVVIRLISYRPC